MPEMTSPQGEVLSVPDGPGVRVLEHLGWTAPKPEPKKDQPTRRSRTKSSKTDDN